MAESGLPGKPNIIFFMLDQLSAKWLEGGSAEACPTPNIDRLRANGVSFSQAITSNPLCCPARATLATGLSTRGHGVLQNGYELDPGITTFMQLLQEAQWRTGAFGKVHLHPHFRSVHPDYSPYGFDVTHITEDPRAGEWLDWVEQEHPEHYESALATVWASGIPELRNYGKDGVDVGARIRNIRKQFAWATEEFPLNTPGAYTLPFPEPVSQTAWITSHAVDFISKSDPAQPICAHISYVQPHGPFCPPAEYMERIAVGHIPEPVPAEWARDPGRPTCFPETESARPEIPAGWRQRRHYYLADVAHLDHKLGAVIKALEESGRLDNAFILLLADHGELLLDHGFGGKGERHYDACIRVPLIIAGPGLQNGRTRDEFVQLEDIFPTVLEMAGLPLPEPKVGGPHLKMRPEGHPGRSLLGLCRGEEPRNWRDSAYVESYNNLSSSAPAFWARTVRTKDWRYTMYPCDEGEQLFCLTDDPDEQRNLAYDPEYGKIRQQMRDRLLDLVILQDYPHTPRSCYAHGVH